MSAAFLPVLPLSKHPFVVPIQIESDKRNTKSNGNRQGEWDLRQALFIATLIYRAGADGVDTTRRR